VEIGRLLDTAGVQARGAAVAQPRARGRPPRPAGAQCGGRGLTRAHAAVIPYQPGARAVSQPAPAAARRQGWPRAGRAQAQRVLQLLPKVRARAAPQRRRSPQQGQALRGACAASATHLTRAAAAPRSLQSDVAVYCSIACKVRACCGPRGAARARQRPPRRDADSAPGGSCPAALRAPGGSGGGRQLRSAGRRARRRRRRWRQRGGARRRGGRDRRHAAPGQAAAPAASARQARPSRARAGLPPRAVGLPRRPGAPARRCGPPAAAQGLRQRYTLPRLRTALTRLRAADGPRRSRPPRRWRARCRGARACRAGRPTFSS
jgi:hypothetical protein